MTEYKYTGNKAGDDGTEVIFPDPEDRERSVRVGETIELSDEEVEALRPRFNFTKQSESESGQNESEGRESSARTSSTTAQPRGGE